MPVGDKSQTDVGTGHDVQGIGQAGGRRRIGIGAWLHPAVDRIHHLHAAAGAELHCVAIENHAFILAAGQFGFDLTGHQFHGHSMIVDPWGTILAQAPGEGGAVLVADIGGQQQRVALARALVKRPALLLLDEPLGALDRKLRKAMQLELKHMQQKLGITFVYVTHDQEEAMTMSDRIAVMSNGRILQVGSPVDIYEDPASRFVADFIGESNFIPATVQSAGDDSVVVRISGGSELSLLSKSASLRSGQDVTLMVRPEKGTVAHQPGAGAEICTLEGRIQEVIFLGNDISYSVAFGENQQVVIRSQNSDRADLQNFQRGENVYVNWKASHIRILSETLENIPSQTTE